MANENIYDYVNDIHVSWGVKNIRGAYALRRTHISLNSRKESIRFGLFGQFNPANFSL